MKTAMRFLLPALAFCLASGGGAAYAQYGQPPQSYPQYRPQQTPPLFQNPRYSPNQSPQHQQYPQGRQPQYRTPQSPQSENQQYPQSQPAQNAVPQNQEADARRPDAARHDGPARAWDAVPGEYSSDLTRGAFRDGVQMGEQEASLGRTENVKREQMFQHPPVDGQFRREYRSAFNRGYQLAFQHAQQTGQDYPPTERDDDRH